MAVEVPPEPDRVAVRRWLSAIGLLDTAEGLAARGSDAESLIVSQAAAETALGLIAGLGPKQVALGVRWDPLVDAATTALNAIGMSFPPGLLSQLNTCQALRNGVVHRGSVAPPNEARASLVVTRRLLDLLPAIGSGFGALPPGAGLAGAVAALINAPEVQDQLRVAEEAVGGERPADAADAAARALGRALARTAPRLIGPRISPRDVATGMPVLRDALDQSRARLSELEQWVVAAVLGIRPRDFARLRGIVGDRISLAGGADTVHRTANPSLADAAWAVRQVAEIVYRLQETGALIEGSIEELRETRPSWYYGPKP
jgi:hypothetical protein